jgi:hypothetical protein
VMLSSHACFIAGDAAVEVPLSRTYGVYRQLCEQMYQAPASEQVGWAPGW